MLPILIIVGGWFLRNFIPWLFYILAIAFLAFLLITAYAGIKEKEYGWAEGMATVFYILIILWFMFG